MTGDATEAAGPGTSLRGVRASFRRSSLAQLPVRHGEPCPWRPQTLFGRGDDDYCMGGKPRQSQQVQPRPEPRKIHRKSLSTPQGRSRGSYRSWLPGLGSNQRLPD